MADAGLGRSMVSITVSPVASPTVVPVVIDWECEEFTKEDVGETSFSTVRERNFFLAIAVETRELLLSDYSN